MPKVTADKSGNIDKMLGKFKRENMKNGVQKDLKKHEFALGKSKKRELKSIEARKNARKNKKGGSGGGNSGYKGGK